jgi:hypothetical protein
MDRMPVTRSLDTSTLGLVARGIARRPELWRPHVVANPEQRHYHRLISEPHMTVWLICWMDGHDTGYHDHDHSCGAVHVARGCIRHEQLRLGERPTGAAVPAGEGFRFDNTFIHRMRREPGAGATVTVHAYSPPLSHTGQYAEHDDGLLHRTPTSSEEQLVPHGRQGTPSDS